MAIQSTDHHSCILFLQEHPNFIHIKSLPTRCLLLAIDSFLHPNRKKIRLIKSANWTSTHGLLFFLVHTPIFIVKIISRRIVDFCLKAYLSIDAYGRFRRTTYHNLIEQPLLFLILWIHTPTRMILKLAKQNCSVKFNQIRPEVL